MNTIPTGTNALASLADLTVSQYNLSQVLDYGRFTIRVDASQGRGYYAADLAKNREHDDLVFAGRKLVAPATIPLQVKLALARAGYDASAAATEA